MRDILPDIERWREEGEPVALATVIETWGSAPRGVGAKMALTPGGKIAGSVSGGCVEGAVFEAGVESLKTGRPQLLHFGVADDTAWAVGLACGGTIEVFVKPLGLALYDPIRAALSEERPLAVGTIVRGPAGLLGREIMLREDGQIFGQLGAGWDEPAAAATRAALAEGTSRRLPLPPPSGAAGGKEGVGAAVEPFELFIEVLLPPPTLVVIGGVHIAVALTTIAKTLGYRTVVVDPRRVFGSEARFPHVDRLIQAWPDVALEQIGLTRQTAVATLTHDPKLDDPALKTALPSPAFFVGALGSRKTQERRRKRLLAEGLSEAQIARLHGPIGLDLGAKTPEEIALSVMAQIVAARNGKLGQGEPREPAASAKA